MSRPTIWTPAEDKRLLEARAKGMRWTQIALLIPGRTRKACLCRATYLADAETIKARSVASTRARRAGRTRHDVRPAVSLRPAGILPFDHPAAAITGCAALHEATMAFYARRAAA